MITGRYAPGEMSKDASDASISSSEGMVIFRASFKKFISRIKKNQKEKSVWKVTRWSVHDYDKFWTLITNIRDLLDGLKSVIASLAVLKRQQALLDDEIRSISSVRSLVLLEKAGSESPVSSLLKTVSLQASQRVSSIFESKEFSSFHTAKSCLSETASMNLKYSPTPPPRLLPLSLAFPVTVPLSGHVTVSVRHPTLLPV